MNDESLAQSSASDKKFAFYSSGGNDERQYSRLLLSLQDFGYFEPYIAYHPLDGPNWDAKPIDDRNNFADTFAHATVLWPR